MDTQSFAVTLTRVRNYQFNTDFHQPDVPTLRLDEPPPLGTGRGPNAARLLAAAIGNCLGASLLLCLEKAHIPVSDLQVTVEGTLRRNDEGRYRIGGIHVTIDPGVDATASPRLQRCLDIFEDFCIVTQSVRQGIDVDVSVQAPAPAEPAMP